MRTKNGKRIGPVPIALVAVLALAATFISAGLLVPTNGAQQDELRQAQGIDADVTTGREGGAVPSGNWAFQAICRRLLT